ncbi:hypothetical protein ACOS73_00017135 [Escherichia coli]|uniref:hypothetical protein n=1 Tax=Escherichia coli TaxID=562 RepID=UPI003523DA89|nr:hypothetical protein [Escherichia coli]
MMKYVYPVTPVCIVFDYSRTLAQKEFPVGLRSLLIREYGDDTAHDVSGLNAFNGCFFPAPCNKLPG